MYRLSRGWDLATSPRFVAKRRYVTPGDLVRSLANDLSRSGAQCAGSRQLADTKEELAVQLAFQREGAKAPSLQPPPRE